MKNSFAAITAAIASVTASCKSVPRSHGLTADSELGMKILSKARRVEEGNWDLTWVSGYSLKFQGCHFVQQWNDNANEGADVRISTKRLIRFRLCPTETCSSQQGGGCKSGYGDYVIDISSFMTAYFETSRKATEYECNYYLTYNCDCEDDGGKGDDFDREICEYECFYAADLAGSCVDNNPYEDDNENEQDEFDASTYAECQQYNPPNNKQNGNRFLEDQGVQYYIGPYCGEQGGGVYLGLFTDDTCTTFADSSAGIDTFMALAGENLPYSEVSMIGPKCLSCLDKQGEADGDGDNVLEYCENIYAAAGKCEYNLQDASVSERNNNACTYIEGIQITRKDGIISRVRVPNRTASVFIVLFALATVGLSYYVYQLRARLGGKKDTLLELNEAEREVIS